MLWDIVRTLLAFRSKAQHFMECSNIIVNLWHSQYVPCYPIRQPIRHRYIKPINLSTSSATYVTNIQQGKGPYRQLLKYSRVCYRFSRYPWYGAWGILESSWVIYVHQISLLFCRQRVYIFFASYTYMFYICRGCLLLLWVGAQKWSYIFHQA